MTCRNFPMSMTGCLLKISSSLHSSNRQLMGSGKCQKSKKMQQFKKVGNIGDRMNVVAQKGKRLNKEVQFPNQYYFICFFFQSPMVMLVAVGVSRGEETESQSEDPLSSPLYDELGFLLPLSYLFSTRAPIT